MLKNREISIIPEPVQILLQVGTFNLDKNTVILSDLKTKKNAEILKQFLVVATDLNIFIKDHSEKVDCGNIIELILVEKDNELNSEGYELNISETNVSILALTPKGIFHGIQTLRQLFPPEIESTKRENIEFLIPCLKIRDYPRFQWRGFMLDESRHFFGKEIVMKILDLMAFLKFNVFHWHLADDQGWRVEIKKYPLLVEIGSKRKSADLTSRRRARKSNETFQYSGHYSQEDLREIVKYASERFINIIPEIDLPGHTTAVIASYPDLSCIGGPFEVSTRFGILKDVLCVGKEKTFEFVKDILNEIISIFPSKTIHFGGDEVPKDRWKECPDCQERMKQEQLNSEKELQAYFTNRVSNFLSSLGRIPVGWNEILNDNLVNEAICQYWTPNLEELLKHLQNGRKVIVSETKFVYLNYGYKVTSLRKSYEYEPIPIGLEKGFYDQIMGIEACLWTEFISDLRRLEYLTFPRLMGIAETGWTLKKNKNYESFVLRLESFLKRLDFYEIAYAPKNEYLIENQ